MKDSETKILAFYLPQFHPIAENNEWWGEGFTEWTNVSNGRPNFVGHYQPHIPRDLGFYDLRRTDVFREQAELAKKFGIHGFCFYWYWFNGRQLLEKPLYNFLNDKSIDLPFCLCWANENWTRTWDGRDKEILLKQEYLDEQLENDFLNKILPFFSDDRYIKVDGKPVLLIYRVDLIPRIKMIVQKWRERVLKETGKGIYLACVYSFNISDHNQYGVDAGVEFPPHAHFKSEDRLNRFMEITNSDFKGSIFDYRGAVIRSLNTSSYGEDETVFRTAIPGWDNTARRQNTSYIMHNSSPALFQHWLKELIVRVNGTRDSEFIFINAWNEWGEGCHLEPDQRYKSEYLQAVRAAKMRTSSSEEVLKDLKKYEQIRNRRQWFSKNVKDKIKERPILFKILLPFYRLLCLFA